MCYLYVWTNEAIVSEIKLFYSILFYSILFYSILFYSILFYSIHCGISGHLLFKDDRWSIFKVKRFFFNVVKVEKKHK